MPTPFYSVSLSPPPPPPPPHLSLSPLLLYSKQCQLLHIWCNIHSTDRLTIIPGYIPNTRTCRLTTSIWSMTVNIPQPRESTMNNLVRVDGMPASKSHPLFKLCNLNRIVSVAIYIIVYMYVVCTCMLV